MPITMVNLDQLDMILLSFVVRIAVVVSGGSIGTTSARSRPHMELSNRVGVHPRRGNPYSLGNCRIQDHVDIIRTQFFRTSSVRRGARHGVHGSPALRGKERTSTSSQRMSTGASSLTCDGSARYLVTRYKIPNADSLSSTDTGLGPDTLVHMI